VKTVATINFKGGVGKTTATWALGYIAALPKTSRILLLDMDAQMSLTQAIALNEDGSPFKSFSDWYEQSIEKKATIFDALEEFNRSDTFKFKVDHNFIYKISDRFHFIPSVQDLYWTELDFFDREKVKHFIRRLLEKIENSQEVPSYDVILFDCPPSFSVLSYSVLSTCDMVLIPINPDFFAAKGLDLLVSSLRFRIEPFPLPKIGVFMNKAKKPGGSSIKKFSNETQRYLDDADEVLDRLAQKQKLSVRLFKTAILDRVGMKRAIQEGMPSESRGQFQALSNEIFNYLGE
jgi:chromosome partitioning protein